MRATWFVLAAGSVALAGCRDVSSFTTSGDSFQGNVVDDAFFCAGVDAGTCMCLTLDANHLQDAPGAVSTTDGRFQMTALRPIPELWRDPLSTLSFGDGRLRNLIYVASSTTPLYDGGGQDVFVVVSLMQSGDVEVRLLAGAPSLGADAAAQSSQYFRRVPADKALRSVPMLVLGIESSCDETAAAVVDGHGLVLSDVVRSQVALHAPYGGVVPELASRDHLRNLGPVVR